MEVRLITQLSSGYILKIGQSLLRGYMYGVKEEKEARGRVQDFWLEHLGG